MRDGAALEKQERLGFGPKAEDGQRHLAPYVLAKSAPGSLLFWRSARTAPAVCPSPKMLLPSLCFRSGIRGRRSAAWGGSPLAGLAAWASRNHTKHPREQREAGPYHQGVGAPFPARPKERGKGGGHEHKPGAGRRIQLRPRLPPRFREPGSNPGFTGHARTSRWPGRDRLPPPSFAIPPRGNERVRRSRSRCVPHGTSG
jgi:hypothetical protein